MRKTVFFLFLFAVLLLTACGGGGGGSASGNAGGWSGNRNAAGFPDVAGMYSCNVGAGSAVCTDGSSATYAPLAMNFRITQNNNQLTLFNTSSTGPPVGTIIVSSDNFDGNVDLDGNLILDQHIIMRTTTDPGNFTLTYTFTGAFDPNGWTGTYQLTVYNDFSRASCTYTSQFTGNRISQNASVLAPPESIRQLPGGGDLIHDFSGLSSFLGL